MDKPKKKLKRIEIVGFWQLVSLRVFQSIFLFFVMFDIMLQAKTVNETP